MPKSDQEFDEALIEEVRKYRFLFDPGHQEYQNMQKKSKVWSIISRKLKVDETRCRQRWKGLRATYVRCRRTEQVINRVSGFPRPKWIFFKSMAFLDDISKSKYTSNRANQETSYDGCDFSNSSDSYDSVDEEINSIESLPMVEDTPTTIESPIPTLKDEILPSTESLTVKEEMPASIESLPMVEETPASNSPASEVQKKTTLAEKIDKFFELTASSLSETCLELIQKSKQDSTSLYFASLAAKIKETNMPQRRVNQIKSKVTALVFSEIEQYLDLIEADDVMK